ncbi:hypothetical protein M422DRAFT_22793 [Sphaerobolus stellatus SS14]|nr:hypothetical protein M422DRAFT_22793 [Sphaerobolus stellatus SS14]
MLDDDTIQRTKSLIGIAVAISGNVLISLALNCQKLAHKRLEHDKQAQADLDDPRSSYTEPNETRPLLPNNDSFTTPRRPSPRPNYSSLSSRRSDSNSGPRNSQPQVPEDAAAPDAVDIEVSAERVTITTHTSRSSRVEKTEGLGNESDYLRSKLWWFGFCLMNIGEFGNFLSYAFAPASVVAPLGTVALIANCFFAPIMLKEKLRKRDLLGVVLAIFGAVTIVGAGKSSDVRLDPKGLIKAITRKAFVIYAIVCAVLMGILGLLSAGAAARRWVFVDVGLCALFGGFTVLSTKAVSTLLSLRLWKAFEDWIIYPVLAILIVTGVGQIKYLNRALMKFDSKMVIPTFFVSFNLSAIVGSAILYGDFENVELHRVTTFLYGCATTFLGVFFLTHSAAETGRSLEEPVLSPGELEDGVDRERATPPTPPLVLPVLKGRRSSTSVVLSPGKYLLLATSPPRQRGGSSERSGSGRGALLGSAE